jgi:hypothetical protein
MERTEVLDMMSELKLFGMRAAYDETLATAVKRSHEPQRFVGDLLRARMPNNFNSLIMSRTSVRSMIRRSSGCRSGRSRRSALHEAPATPAWRSAQGPAVGGDAPEG